MDRSVIKRLNRDTLKSEVCPYPEIPHKKKYIDYHKSVNTTFHISHSRKEESKQEQCLW